MNYVKIPNSDISFLWIPRTASHAISKALLATYWPEKLARAEITNQPEGMIPPYQIFLPETRKPETRTIVGLLRDPVERFRSACARTNHTAAEGIAAASTPDGHFKPASAIANGNKVTWFKFPAHLEEFCAAVGIPVPAVLNESETGTKPTLTAEELEQVTTTYSDDIAFFEAATGTVIVEPTPEPQLTTAEKINEGKRFVQNAGYGADEKVICLNKLLKVKEACATAVPPVDINVAFPKLVAVYTWLETVQAMAVAGQVNFPPAPHTFEEVVSE
jgi:hypothetical protein